tara:strand:- start:1010 stop:2029 length:1020 start_codon:yes stop_codon:yes gene_type:complete
MFIKNKKSLEENLLIDVLFSKNCTLNDSFEKVNYDKLIEIASQHLMLPSLYIKLIKQKQIPKEVKIYLSKIFNLNNERNQFLFKEINYLSNFLSKNKIEHVFIKGASNIIAGDFELNGERMINDIDILIKSEQLIFCLNKLKEIKYFSTKINPEIYTFSKHLPRLINKEKLFAVELHSRPFRKKIKSFDAKDIFNNMIEINKVKIPKPTDRVKINIYNNQLNDYCFYSLKYNYRSYYDVYSVILKNNIDLNEIGYDKYIKNYLNILTLIITGAKEFNKFRKNFSILLKLRIKLKYSNKYLFKVDDWIFNFLIYISIFEQKLNLFVRDSNYRKFIKLKYF